MKAKIEKPLVKLHSNFIEAANRAEVTALLIRCNFRVYRPEADVQGEDLVLRLPDRTLLGVQLKSRPTVDQKRYGGHGLQMLFPSQPFTPTVPRPWFLIPHDTLFEWVEKNHGHTAKWEGYWHTPSPSKAFLAFLSPFQIRPPSEPAGASDLSEPISN